MKKITIALVVIVLALALMGDIGFTMRDALANFPNIQPAGNHTAINIETGCTTRKTGSNWTTFRPDESVFFEGGQGAAVNALLFSCP